MAGDAVGAEVAEVFAQLGGQILACDRSAFRAQDLDDGEEAFGAAHGRQYTARLLT